MIVDQVEQDSPNVVFRHLQEFLEANNDPIDSVMISGSRKWRNHIIVENVLNLVACYSNDETTLFEGGADGADGLGLTYWRSIGRPVATFLPNYAKNGDRAPLIRNDRMLDNRPSLVVAFPLSDSRGTRYVIREAMLKHIPLFVFEGD